MQDTVVVVPCYNEAARLDRVAFDRKLAQTPELRFVFVDDGSTDGTAVLLNDLAARWPGRAVPLLLPRNGGKAEAVRQGMLHALRLNPTLVGYWDADLATPLAEIDRFAEGLDHAGRVLVMGSRIRRLGSDIRRLPVRHYLGRIVATVAAGILALGVYDTQCGAKLFRVHPALANAFSRPFELDWLFDVELLERLQGQDPELLTRECLEQPLDSWTDAPGSKLTPRQFRRVAFEIVRLPGVVRRARAGAWPLPNTQPTQ
jgi:glycosyltransferase involved in cell wall biosynthesis